MRRDGIVKWMTRDGIVEWMEADPACSCLDDPALTSARPMGSLLLMPCGHGVREGNEGTGADGTGRRDAFRGKRNDRG